MNIQDILENRDKSMIDSFLDSKHSLNYNRDKMRFSEFSRGWECAIEWVNQQLREAFYHMEQRTNNRNNDSESNVS